MIACQVVRKQHFTLTAGRGLVVETKVAERSTRFGAHRMLYQFRVEDPTVWTKPWGGEYEFSKASGMIYEYACHEATMGSKTFYLAPARTKLWQRKRPVRNRSRQNRCRQAITGQGQC
jgi:hypothetical protein